MRVMHEYEPNPTLGLPLTRIDKRSRVLSAAGLVDELLMSNLEFQGPRSEII